MAKQYGLIVSKKSKSVVPVKKLSVFEDSSSDEEVETKGPGKGKAFRKSLWRENKKNAMQVESHGAVIKALEEDPEIFDYDGQYDMMQEQKRKADPRLVKKDRDSKYIAKLKKVAERRQVEQDIIYERKVQREMEQEGKDYGDKDTFLTTAYRQKLEERKKLEEELKIALKKEEAEDVTKQVDISRFHRTLLNKITKKEDRSKVVVGGTEGSGDGEDEVGEEVSHKDQLAESRLSPGTENPIGSLSEQHMPDDDVTSPSGLERREGDEPGSVERRESRTSTGGDEVSPEDVEAAALFPPTVDKEKRRKIAATKRVNEETLQSAKERFMARKKAKRTAPVISDD